MPKFVYYGVKDGVVVSLMADIGPEIADDVAEAIRDGQAIHRAAIGTAPALFDPAPSNI